MTQIGNQRLIHHDATLENVRTRNPSFDVHFHGPDQRTFRPASS